MVLCTMFHIQWSHDECSPKISSALMSSQFLLNDNHEASEETCFYVLVQRISFVFSSVFSLLS